MSLIPYAAAVSAASSVIDYFIHGRKKDAHTTGSGPIGAAGFAHALTQASSAHKEDASSAAHPPKRVHIDTRA